MADKDTIISALQTQANIIKNERKQQANTAMRIGSMFSAIVEVLEQIIYIDNLFSLVKDQNGNYYIYTPYPLASEKSISTKGLGGSGNGNTGGALAMYQLNDVLADGEKVAGSIAGNVLTFKDGRWQGTAIEIPKTDLNGYATEEWVNATLSEYVTLGTIQVIESEIQKNSDDISALSVTVKDFLTGTETDGIINKWKELEAFLEGQTETSTLAELLSVKADKDEIVRLEKDIHTNADGLKALLATLSDYFTLEGDVLTTKYNLVSMKAVSTKGIGSSSGGGGSFDRLDTWPDAWDDKYGTYVLSAYLGYDLNTRVATIENNIGSKVTTLGDLANVSSTVNEESTKDTMMFKDAGRNEWRAISVEEVSEITDKTFVYTQGTAKNTWTIVHNLNKYPTVSVIDSAKTVVIGEVRYDSLNQVTLLFASAFSGMATLN